MHAHGVRFQPDLAGDRVDGHVGGETDPGPRHAAIGAQRRLVGCHRVGARPVGGDIVWPGQIAARHGRFQAVGERIDRIRARIDRHLRVEAEDLALGIRVSRDDVVVFAAIGVGDQVLAPVLDPFHRAAEFARSPAGDQHFGFHIGLEPESAAHIGSDHAHLALFQPEEFGQPGADQMGHLGRCMDDELVGAFLPFGDHGPAFHGHHGLPRHAVFASHLDRRLRSRFVHVAVEKRLQRDVVAPVLVDQRGAGLARLQHVDHGGNFLVLDLDLLGQVLRLGAGVADAGDHGLAREPGLVARQGGKIGCLVARQF